MDDSIPAANTAKALTLHAPYGDLIMEGVKRFETRPTRFNYRGRLWIHTAQRYPNLSERWGDYLICGTIADSLGLDLLDLVLPGEMPVPLQLGCVIGYVDVVDCLPIIARGEAVAESLHVDGNGTKLSRRWWGDLTDQLPFGDFTPGRWAIELANPVRVDPFPAKGQQARPWNLELPLLEVRVER